MADDVFFGITGDESLSYIGYYPTQYETSMYDSIHKVLHSKILTALALPIEDVKHLLLSEELLSIAIGFGNTSNSTHNLLSGEILGYIIPVAETPNSVHKVKADTIYMFYTGILDNPIHRVVTEKDIQAPVLPNCNTYVWTPRDNRVLHSPRLTC